MRCSCCKAGVSCVDCYPLQYNRCQNIERGSILNCSSEDQPRANQILTSDENDQPRVNAIDQRQTTQKAREQLDEAQSSISQPHKNLWEMKMQQAFGASILSSEGGARIDAWSYRWKAVTALRSRQYVLPNGAVGREFVDILSEEVRLLSRGMVKSERLIVFMIVLLQRDSMIRNGYDIRRLLKRRMNAWREGQFDELQHEAIRLMRQQHWIQPRKQDEENTIKVFTRLMLKGQVRAAVRWMTERASGGGVLDPSSQIDANGKTVLEGIREKFPDPTYTVERAFLPCDELPPLVDIDVTGAHVERVARRI